MPLQHRTNVARTPRGGDNRGVGHLANAQMGQGGGGGNGDTFVTTVGYEKPPTKMQKVGNSLAGLFFGPVLIFFGCVLLWYNEEWAIKTHRSLHEALDAHVALSNAQHHAPEHRGKLVHLTSMVSVEGRPVEDPVFGLTRPKAVALERKVEIYQWVEEIKKKKMKPNDGKSEILEVVKYKKKWVPKPIDSSEFRHLEGHENCCGSLPMRSESFQADQVKVGRYLISDQLTKQMSHTSNVPASEVKTLPEGGVSSGSAVYLPRGGGGVQSAAALPSGEGAIEERITRVDGQEKIMYVLKSTGDSYSTREKALAAANADAIEERVTRVDGEETTVYFVKATGEAYTTKEKAFAAARGVATARTQSNRHLAQRLEDEIGDVKITFSEVPCATVSVLAQISESGDELVPWRSKQGSGYEVIKLSYGVKSATDMIEEAKTGNTVKTWTLRFFGWLLNFIGFNMITSIISTTADITLNWIPLLGPMATSIINLGVNIANFIMANCTTMIVASIAWVFYRPVLGVSLLVGSLGLFFAASQAGKGKHSPMTKPSKATQ